MSQLAITVAVAVLATVGCPPPRGKCPRAAPKRPLVVTGNLHFRVRDVEMSQTFASSNRDCTASSNVWASWSPGDRRAPLEGTIGLACHVPSARVTVTLNRSLGVLARMTQGSQPVIVTISYSSPGEGAARACEARREGQLVVTRATGGEAPVPAIVTPDFVRELRLEVHDTDPIQGLSGGQPCSPLTIDATLHVVIRAEDIDSRPDNLCPPALG